MTTRLWLWGGFFALFSTVNYVGRFGGGRPDRNALYQYSTAAGGAIQYAVILGLVLGFAVGLSWRDAFALRRPRSWRGAVGLIAAVLVGIYVVAAILDPFLHPGREQGLTPDRWHPSHAGAYVANFVVVALVAPIVEELSFRGLGYTLLERFGRWPAILLVGLAFGLAHGLVEALPLLALFGCALAYIRSRTRSIYPGMILHGLFNGIALVAAVTT
ncbi:MAG: CPBP family intramembrane glutamic endopeptidase [Gaiellaceae bacterium]